MILYLPTMMYPLPIFPYLALIAQLRPSFVIHLLVVHTFL